MTEHVRAQAMAEVSAPSGRIAELATTALTRLGWTIKFVNPGLKQLVAFDNKNERVMGTNWRYTFDAVVRWHHGNAVVLVEVQVSEKENTWTQEQCEQRCRDILEAIVSDAGLLEQVELASEPSTAYGSARWATSEDVEACGYRGGRGDSRRFVLGPGADDQFLSVPASDTERHALVCGPTGSGKTSSIFIPNLIERGGVSAIVTEATAGDERPDLFLKTSGFRQRAGHRIFYFNPDDLSSHRLNPIDQVQSIDQAQNVANLIIQNTSKKYSGGDPIWETSERHLLTALILHAAGERGSLGDVRRWLREGPVEMGTILQDSQVVAAREEYKAFYKNSTEGFRNGVTSGLMQRLNLWVNPRIVALTQTTDFDVNELTEHLFTFYMAVPAQKTHLKPLAALAFNFILDMALDNRFRHPLALFLDEFTNFGYIPAIAEKLTIIRHRKIAATLGIQGYVQLEKVYGREDAALLFGQPGTRIFFRPGDEATAQKISASLGTKTILERKMTSSGHIQEREFGRSLMNPGEILAMDRANAVAFTPSTPPMMFRTFSWRDYERQTSYPPPEREPLQVDERLKWACEDAKAKADWERYLETEKETNKRARKPKKEQEREPDYEEPPIL